MEDVCAVLMDIDPLDALGIRVAGDVIAPVDNQTFLPAGGRFVREYGAE